MFSFSRRAGAPWPDVLDDLSMDRLHTVLWGVMTSLRDPALLMSTVQHRLSVADCLLTHCSDGDAPAPSLPGPANALALFAARCRADDDPTVWQWCRDLFQTIESDPLDVVDAASRAVPEALRSWWDAPMPVLLPRPCYTLVRLADLPSWHNPGRCEHRPEFERRVGEVQQARWRRRPTSRRAAAAAAERHVAAEIQTELVTGALAPCSMHHPPLHWAKLNDHAVFIRDSASPWTVPAIRDATSRLSLTPHESAVLVAPSTRTCTRTCRVLPTLRSRYPTWTGSASSTSWADRHRPADRRRPHRAAAPRGRANGSVERDCWCHCCGAAGVPRDIVVRQLAHVPNRWRPTVLQVRIRRHGCACCGRVWRQDLTKAAAPRSKLTTHAVL